MKLLLIRHAPAQPQKPGEMDKDRPLSKEGSKQFCKLCKSLAHVDFGIDLLLESPLRRSRQTATLFCKYFAVKQKQTSHQLKPSSSAEELFTELKTYNKQTIALIGHQPFLTSFMSYCLTKSSNKTLAFLKRGSLALLDFPLSQEAGSAFLEFLIQPELFIKE